MTGEAMRGAWATAYCNSDFICVRTNSGYRGGTDVDPQGKQKLLEVDASDEALGLALLDAMAHSRWVLGAPREGTVYPPGIEFDSDLYDYSKSLERYASWVELLIKNYSYKTRQALFKNMMNCYVERKNGVITIIPSDHEKLEAWGREKDDGIEDVVVLADSTLVQIGVALRLAFSRCTG